MSDKDFLYLDDAIYELDPDNDKPRMKSELVPVTEYINYIKPVDSYKWDETDTSILFAECFKNLERYCKETKTWYSYDGTRWVKDIGSILVNRRLLVFIKLLNMYGWRIPDEAIRTRYVKFIAKLYDRRVRDRMIKDIQEELAVSITEFDNHPHLLNCRNGTFDLDRCKFYPHNPEDLITLITDCEYPSDGEGLEFHRWEEFIDEITCGDKALARYLQKALGYSLYGINHEECMFIAYGKTTRNGKGTLLNTIYKILGDYGNTIRVQFICKGGYKKSHSSADPMLASLQATRFLTMSETDEGILDEEEIKLYTGNDPISTRDLYSSSFTFTPQFTMWLSCNYLPRVTNSSLFTSGRLKVIPFNKHFGKEERDITLKSLFLDDYNRRAILNWLLWGHRIYRQEGLDNEPPAVRNAIVKYQSDNDYLKVFIDERCEEGEKFKISRPELHRAFNNWLKVNDIKTWSALRFSEDISNKYSIRKSDGIYYVIGIKLKNTNVFSLN